MNKIDYKSESIRTRFFLACIIDFLVFMFLLFIALVGVYAYPSKLLTFAAVHLIFGYFIISNIWIPSLGFYITRIRVIDTINDSSVKSLYKKIVVNILSIFGIIGFFSFTEMFWSNQYFDYIFIMLLFLLAIDIIFFLYSKSRNRLFLKLFKMEIIKLE